jgi:hypothetical protein
VKKGVSWKKGERQQQLAPCHSAHTIDSYTRMVDMRIQAAQLKADEALTLLHAPEVDAVVAHVITKRLFTDENGAVGFELGLADLKRERVYPDSISVQFKDATRIMPMKFVQARFRETSAAPVQDERKEPSVDETKEALVDEVETSAGMCAEAEKVAQSVAPEDQSSEAKDLCHVPSEEGSVREKRWCSIM